jgi:hypothetical protein
MNTMQGSPQERLSRFRQYAEERLHWIKHLMPKIPMPDEDRKRRLAEVEPLEALLTAFQDVFLDSGNHDESYWSNVAAGWNAAIRFYDAMSANAGHPTVNDVLVLAHSHRHKESKRQEHRTRTYNEKYHELQRMAKEIDEEEPGLSKTKKAIRICNQKKKEDPNFNLSPDRVRRLI